MLVYDSRTRNVQNFVSKLDYPPEKIFKINENLTMNEPFVLITYTTGYGEVPETTLKFLESNHKNLIGVSASGNKNWGDNFAKSADKIGEMYGVPVISKFELRGRQDDVVTFIEGMRKVYEVYRTK